jgi:hypothetical protein
MLVVGDGAEFAIFGEDRVYVSRDVCHDIEYNEK